MFGLSVADPFVGPLNLKYALNIGYATMERNPLQFCSIQQADQSVPITNRKKRKWKTIRTGKVPGSVLVSSIICIVRV